MVSSVFWKHGEIESFTYMNWSRESVLGRLSVVQGNDSSAVLGREFCVPGVIVLRGSHDEVSTMNGEQNRKLARLVLVKWLGKEYAVSFVSLPIPRIVPRSISPPHSHQPSKSGVFGHSPSWKQLAALIGSRHVGIVQRRTDRILGISDQARRLQKALRCAEGDVVSPARVPGQECLSLLRARPFLFLRTVRGSIDTTLRTSMASHQRPLLSRVNQVLALIRLMNQGAIFSLALSQRVARLSLGYGGHFDLPFVVCDAKN